MNGGRPIKFPDSNPEREQLKLYLIENLSLRRIGKELKMSKDMIKLKITRYDLIDFYQGKNRTS